MSRNRLTIIGHMGADAELKTTSAGPVLELRVAVNEVIKGDKITTWVRASVWGKRAEALGGLGLTKGTLVMLSGPAKARAWVGDDGEARSSLEMTAFDVELLGGGNRDNSARPSTSYGNSNKPQQHRTVSARDDDFGDQDIPF